MSYTHGGMDVPSLANMFVLCRSSMFGHKVIDFFKKNAFREKFPPLDGQFFKQNANLNCGKLQLRDHFYKQQFGEMCCFNCSQVIDDKKLFS